MLRILTGRERGTPVSSIHSPSDVPEFVRRNVFGGVAAGGGKSDEKLLRSYNFAKSDGGLGVAAQLPIVTVRSVMELVVKILKGVIGLIGLTLRTGVKVTKAGVAVARKAIDQAQKGTKK